MTQHVVVHIMDLLMQVKINQLFEPNLNCCQQQAIMAVLTFKETESWRVLNGGRYHSCTISEVKMPGRSK